MTDLSRTLAGVDASRRVGFARAYQAEEALAALLPRIEALEVVVGVAQQPQTEGRAFQRATSLASITLEILSVIFDDSPYDLSKEEAILEWVDLADYFQPHPARSYVLEVLAKLETSGILRSHVVNDNGTPTTVWEAERDGSPWALDVGIPLGQFHDPNQAAE